MSLDEGDERRVEGGGVLPDLLEHDAALLENRHRRRGAQALRRAVDVNDVRAGVGVALGQNDPVTLDPPDVAEPDHVLDLPKRIELGGAEHRDPVHRRLGRGVDPDKPP